MHPLVAYDLARQKIAQFDREVERDRLVAVAREGRHTTAEASAAQPHWFLRRLLVRLVPSAAGG
jgi:hypothetical protein